MHATLQVVEVLREAPVEGQEAVDIEEYLRIVLLREHFLLLQRLRVQLRKDYFNALWR